MTKHEYTLSAVKRTVLGRKVNKLRAQSLIPADVYGKNLPSLSLSLPEKEFLKVMREAGETALISLTIDGEKTSRPVLIVEIQRHPVTNIVLHASLRQVDLKVKVEAKIPVETVGESLAVKAGHVLVLAHNEIPIKALPTDLPEKFTVDISSLAEVGNTITVKQLAVDLSKVEIELPEDEVLITIQEKREEVVEVAPTVPVEVETTVQGTGEEKVEGEKDAGKEKASKEEVKPAKEEKK